MFVATFDNPATMCREAWQDGTLVEHINGALLDAHDFRGHPSMHMGLSGGHFKVGSFWGDMRALDNKTQSLVTLYRDRDFIDQTKPRDGE